MHVAKLALPIVEIKKFFAIAIWKHLQLVSLLSVLLVFLEMIAHIIEDEDPSLNQKVNPILLQHQPIFDPLPEEVQSGLRIDESHFQIEEIGSLFYVV